MKAGTRQPTTQIGQLIAAGMRRQGIPSWHKLEELCEVSHGYLAHLIEGHIQNPKEETLRRLAHVLGQRVEEYRAVLLADRHELPTPVYYFSAHLGESVDERAAELVMQLLEELVKRRNGKHKV
jgi:hypothetical protein